MPIYPTGKKKDGRQQYRVRVNYTEGGDYCQKEQLCYGYREAVELEHRLRNLYAADGNRGEILLRDFYEEYMRQRKGEIRETSFGKMKSVVENQILPELGDLSLSDLDAKVIIDWKAGIAEKGLSISYRRRIFGSLNTLLNHAVRIGYIHENPTNNLENFRDTNFEVENEKLQYYTAEEFQRFISAAEASVTGYYDRSIYMFFVIAYFTGMRKGEIHALRWSDIDGDAIRVRRSVSQKIKGKPAVETPPKNKASMRTIQIPEPLGKVLAEYKILQQLQYRKTWTEQFRVVYGERCISDTALANYNIAWANAAGLHHIRIHDFRHSHASLLANEGINIQEIARRLGHSNVQITWRTYSHLYPREEERAVKVLNQIAIHEFPTKKA